jgi:hypothetical protein
MLRRVAVGVKSSSCHGCPNLPALVGGFVGAPQPPSWSFASLAPLLTPVGLGFAGVSGPPLVGVKVGA